jgi:hypothetical protein
MHDELRSVRKGAQSKIDTGAEPPWAWYQYMKLVETCDAILAGTASSTVTMENSLQSALHPDVHLRLVDSTYLQDTSRPPHVGLPAQMPM